MTWPFPGLWEHALTFDRFVAEAEPRHKDLWTNVYRLAVIPLWASERAAALGQHCRLVALSEDWCGDAVNSVPLVAKLAAESSGLELRILRRDEHPAVMDRYLTGGEARSIPVVVALTDAMQELGWWGPRPAELQAWVMAQRAAGVNRLALYPEIRRWYAKDRGASVLREVLALLERSNGSMKVS
jgi:thioredoxin-like negative regulator of GroEL